MTSDPSDIIAELERLRDLARRLLDPEDFGHAVPREIRIAARRALDGKDDKPLRNPEPRR